MDNVSSGMEFNPIGTIHTPFKELEGIPIQTVGGQDIEETVELKPELIDGLKDLDGFSHIILLYHFHHADSYSLQVSPYLDKTKRGVFATRIPGRPNPIGISIVRLKKIEGNILHIKDIDIIDGTPLLDIKPYIPAADIKENVRFGWLETRIKDMHHAKGDGRTK